MIDNLLSKINTQVAELIHDARECTAEQLGLDKRAGSKLYVIDGAIIVRKSRDRDLCYYGGFEYINVANRIELGDYVIYRNDERVEDCIDYLNCFSC